MDWEEFTERYPETAETLPETFADLVREPLENPEKHHFFRDCIRYGRKPCLEHVERLVGNGPAGEIVGNSNSSLLESYNFRGFLAELKAFVVGEALIGGCQVLDTSDSEGRPDLTCQEFGVDGVDVEATYIGQGIAIDILRGVLFEKFGPGVCATVGLKDEYNRIPTTGAERNENERWVRDIKKNLEDIDDTSHSFRLENRGIELVVHDVDRKGILIRWGDFAENITLESLAPGEGFRERLEGKAKKDWESSSWILLIDVDVELLEDEEIDDILIGTPGSWLKGEPSSLLAEPGELWMEYNERKGLTPNGEGSLKEGDEGLLAEAPFRELSGVLWLDKDDVCRYVPNVYSKDPEAKELSDCILERMGHGGISLRDLFT